MNIRTFKPEEYKKCKIYYRNFQDHFEYFTIVKKELYTAHIKIRPYWITKILYMLDIFTVVDKSPYSQEQLKHILGALRKMAESTIDYVLSKK